MSSPVANRPIVDLRATAQKNKYTTKSILVMHALTGADTVAATYNVGKKQGLKTLETTNPDTLSIIGDPQADLDEVLYNTNFSRGGNFRYIRELGFCAKFSSRENNIHCEWNFAKLSSREIYLPRNFPPREN